MMINKRLINELSSSKKYIFLNVLLQWISLIATIIFTLNIADFIQKIYEGGNPKIDKFIIISVLTLSVRVVSNKLISKMVFETSKDVKSNLREKLYKKLLRIGISYNKNVGTSEVVQLGTEGIEQLDMYFGRYLPQLFYSILAPITLFIVLSKISVKSAVVLLICVPLIPMTIVFVQKVAKKLFGSYWGDYTDLSQTFLENIQGLTTLKVYSSDEFKNRQMNEIAERFRKSTMKVLYMQLNSIILMDIIAFGGAALGIIFSVTELQKGNISLAGALIIILLSAEFFIPLRLLGSFFHVAMNGMAASDQIFRVLDLKEDEKVKKSIDKKYDIELRSVEFGYTKNRKILKNVNIDIPEKGFIAIAGESGCGKSTIASLIMGIEKGYEGSIKIGGIELYEISEKSIMENITLVKHDSYIFKGTVRENLLVANSLATEEEMNRVLKQVNMYEFLKSRDGLDTEVKEQATNFSGGQKQRLAIARALLHDTPIYIFDEASSNVDVESENYMMDAIYSMSKQKTVIFISHRLANVVDSDKIYLLKNGVIIESGSHNQLIQMEKAYYNLFMSQYELENYMNSRMEDSIYERQTV